MSDTVLPHSVRQPHIVAFDLLMKQRLDDIHLDALLIYMIDTVNNSALIYLAEQFNVMGYKGWKLADTDQKKRALIKKAIELHRCRGTIWSIKEALKTIGFPDATITEHVNHWAGFTVELNVGGQPVNAEQIAEATTIIKAYKNVRSHMMGVNFKIEVVDRLTVTDDSFEAPGDDYEDSLFTGGNFKYNGKEKYDGSRNYSKDTDVLELTIT